MDKTEFEKRWAELNEAMQSLVTVLYEVLPEERANALLEDSIRALRGSGKGRVE